MDMKRCPRDRVMPLSYPSTHSEGQHVPSAAFYIDDGTFSRIRMSWVSSGITPPTTGTQYAIFVPRPGARLDPVPLTAICAGEPAG
jgi:hypothetical protein